MRISLGRPLKMRIYVEGKRSSYCVAPIEHMLSILRCYITGWGVRPIDSTSETCNNLLRLRDLLRLNQDLFQSTYRARSVLIQTSFG